MVRTQEDKCSDIISEIVWRREDIATLLQENGQDYSEQAVDDFLRHFNMRHFEEQCIRLGWELLQSGLED